MTDHIEVMARAIAKAKGVEICSDAMYRFSSSGHLATAAYAALRETLVPVMYSVEEEGHPIISYITREKPTEPAATITPLYALPEIK